MLAALQVHTSGNKVRCRRGPDGYLGRDTEHVFEVKEHDFGNPMPGAERTIWLPALRYRVDGEERLVHVQAPEGAVWAAKPRLVKIDDIAHMLTSEQLANMKQGDRF